MGITGGINLGIKNPKESLAEGEQSVKDQADINLDTGDLNKLDLKVGSVLGKLSDLGIDAAEAILKTSEGKKILLQIGKRYLKKYWWALAAIGVLDLIGIFAIGKFTLSRK